MLSTMVETMIWSVRYNDGSEVHEYPDPDTHHGFGEVRVEDVAILTLAPNHWLGCTGPIYMVPCGDGVRPIMFRRNMLNAETGEHKRWHVFGWQKTVNDTNVKNLTYISNEDVTAPVIMSSEDLEV